MDFKSILAIFICAVVFELPWPINMIISFFVLTKSMHKFCITPLAQKLSEHGNTPTNYMTRKLKNIREVIWVVGCLMEIELLIILEIFLIAYGAKKMGESTGPIAMIRTNDGEIHEELFFKETDVENNQTSFLNNFSIRTPEKENKKISITYNSYDNETLKNIKEERLENNMIKTETKTMAKFEEPKVEPKKEIFENKVDEVDSVFVKKIEMPKTTWDLFDKPIDDIKTDFSVSTTTPKASAFDFNKPVESMVTSKIDATIKEEFIEMKDDEVRCEKCGEVMSKNKIACPKCGELVKYKPGK